MTDVCIILDESGSMAARKNETIAAFDQYIQDVRADGSVEFVYTVLFGGTRVIRLHDHEHISNISSLRKEGYEPRGGTPLYDAVGQTLNDMIGNRMFVIVITDGAENTSREYSREAISNMIAEREAQGWDFIFLGADFDAWGNARGLGVAHGKTLSFATQHFARGMTQAARATTQYDALPEGERLPDDYFTNDMANVDEGADEEFRSWMAD